MPRKTHPLTWSHHRNSSLSPMHAPGNQGETVAGPPSPREYGNVPAIRLHPGPGLPSGLAAAIAARASCRRFREQPLVIQTLAALLQAAYGVTGTMVVDNGHEYLERTVPSAGGFYPLELYVLARNIEATAPGVYHYAPVTGYLELLNGTLPSQARLAQLFLGQPFLQNAAAVVVFTCRPDRTLAKYGDRGYRYALLEAGHAAQNINLGASALGLGVLNLGGFLDDEVAGLLGLERDIEFPVYAVALGQPAEGDRMTLRRPELFD
jgi:SagB-type dehydrogenase family enzyme